MRKRRNKLSNMTIKSVDVCTRGANQEADIVLTKSDEGGETVSVYKRMTEIISKKVSKATADMLGEFSDMMQTSEDSIMNDESMNDQEKLSMLDKSIDQFFEAVQKAVDEDEADDDGEEEHKEKEESADDAEGKEVEKEANVDMEFDVAKMTEEERAAFEVMKEKFGVKAEEKTVEKSEEIHPEVKKAMDEVAELRKSLEMKELEEVAKAYEICGKQPKELAATLYDLKKAGGNAYEQYIGLLNEMKATSESGIFKEIGSNRSRAAHSTLNEAVAEVQKQFPNLSAAEAVVKAYELNPELEETI